MSEKERLNYFLAVAKFGGVKPASEVLGVNQAYLFRKIHSLEEEYNAKFFSRNYRGLDLTEEGKKFFDLAQTILLKIEKFEKEIESKDTTEESRSLIIGSSFGLTSAWIAPNIPAFLSLYPHVSVTVNVEMREFNFNAIDLCVSTKVPDRDDLIQKKVRTCVFKLYASRDYLARYGRPKTPKELDRHRLIFFAGEDRLLIREAENLLQIGSDGKVRTPTVIINSAVGELQVMVRGGGIACVETSWPEVRSSDIVDLFPEIEKKVDIYAIYRKDNQNALISAFINLLLGKNEENAQIS